MTRSSLTAAVLFALAWLTPALAQAFCGFYVSGADNKLYNNATLVVMMREGKRTVLSMQNNYQGPPEDFAMVVPVPVVLQEANVKTLPKEIFDRVDALSAPRLVEYWEQDPCARLEEAEDRSAAPSSSAAAKGESKKDEGGVKVEAQFTVGEYEVVILSATDSGGLDKWLREKGYKIPEGAEPLLKPYVEAGSKFFVAKVNTAKVKMVDGQAMLSPLRFHYDTDDFRLPVRLGLVNSQGTQDLIVHIIARGQRYEVSNYDNVTIPTNIDVDEKARARFGEFYAALFDATLARKKGAVVTEYSWDASSCDPCPVPALEPNELATLGLDVLDQASEGEGEKKPPACNPGDPLCDPSSPPSPPTNPWGFVITRLHARYSKDSLGEDLVFKKADAIMGGREVPGDGGKLERGAMHGEMNNFQARYAIRHPWNRVVSCKNPRYGVWGGPPGGGEPKPSAARDLAFVPRGKVELASLVKSDVPELEIKPVKAVPKPKPEPEPAKVAPKTDSKDGCSCRAGGDSGDAAGALLVVLGAALAMRRSKRAG